MMPPLRSTPDYSPKRVLVHNALEEAWTAYLHPTEPTEDIDLVWALSAPGTVKTPAQFEQEPENPYNGESFNVGIVNHAVSVVLKVTALRTGKTVEEVTKDDIINRGPKLLYNGESLKTKGTRFSSQNEDFLELCRHVDFPIPFQNIIIGEIAEAHTPAQVKQLAELLRRDDGVPPPRKVAVVCGIPHMVRTGRYLQHFRTLFSDGTSFVPSVIPQGSKEKMSKLTALEVRKALFYAAVGHLDPSSIFFPNGVPDARPRNVLRDQRTTRQHK
ncbi:hypothetical protein IPL68_02665 [Candidatus Saccharibacteria bacterium]|nr:MAG: hypothetical protein IPL68_02665 [Candidatus Saccharibacteria bacterium]